MSDSRTHYYDKNGIMDCHWECTKAQAARLQASLELWKLEAAKCFIESGADPDGMKADELSSHIRLGEAIAEVEELRRAYNDTIMEMKW